MNRRSTGAGEAPVCLHPFARHRQGGEGWGARPSTWGVPCLHGCSRLQHSYFNWIKLNFLKKKLLCGLRRTLDHLLYLKTRTNFHRAFYFYSFPPI